MKAEKFCSFAIFMDTQQSGTFLCMVIIRLKPLISLKNEYSQCYLEITMKTLVLKTAVSKFKNPEKALLELLCGENLIFIIVSLLSAVFVVLQMEYIMDVTLTRWY